MITNRELRIAIAAHQRRLVDSEQLAEACAHWSSNPSASVARFLSERGWVSAMDVELLEDSLEAGPAGNGDGGTIAADSQPIEAEASSRATVAATLAEAPAPGHPHANGFDQATLALATAHPEVCGQETIALTVDGNAQHTLAYESSAIRGTLHAESEGPAAADADVATLPADDSPTPLGHVLVGTIGNSGSETREHYTLTKLHAKGGIGQVWLARDTSLGREVALKELRPEASPSSNAEARFLEEARITGQLEHPGIVPVYELTRLGKDQNPFYTMRFIRGRTLNEAILEYHEKRECGTAGPLDRARLLNAFVGVCHAVHYAHSRGVIHRDLKGQNVVLGDYGEVMVLDWGLAKVIGKGGDRATGVEASGLPAPEVQLSGEHATHNPTLQGQIQGTPAYMAPEQAEGRVEDIDFRTDVYGLGAILYEILAGIPPFSASTMQELLRQVCKEAPPSPRLTDPSAPAALEAVCMKALAKRSVDRYQTVGDLGMDVTRWLADEPVSVYQEPWTIRFGRWAKKHRTAVSSTAALLATAIVALTVSSVLVRRERDEATRQRDEAARQRHQARSAVDDMYSKVADQWLEDRLDPLQREFLDKALAYYEKFTQADGADPTVRQERGRAYLRMGDVLKKLGRHDEAERSYKNAIAILATLAQEEPKVAGHRHHLAFAETRLADSLRARARYTEAEPLYKQAATLHQALVAEEPGADHALYQAKADTGLAELLRDQGRSKEAEAAFRRADLLLAPLAKDATSQVEPRQEMAAVQEGLGRILRESNRVEESAASYRRAIDLLEPLLAESPTLPQIREGLAKAYNSLGHLALDAGPPEQAESALRREVALNERLVEDFPQRPEYRRELARGLLNLGIVLQEMGSDVDAEGVFRRALATNEKLAAEFPDVVRFRRDLARCQNALGAVFHGRGRNTDAEALHLEALAGYRKLSAEAPTVPDHKFSIASTLLYLGEVQLATSQRPTAENSYTDAIAILDALTADHPENPDYPRVEAKCLDHLGNVLAADDKREEAEDAYRRASDLYEAELAKPSDSSDRPALRLALAQCLSNRGDNLRSGKLPGAEPVFRRAIELAGALVAGAPNNPAYRRQLAIGNVNFGEFLVAAGRPRDAEAAYQTSADLFAALSAEIPADAGYKSEQAYVLNDLANLHLDEKHPDAARPILEQAIASQRAAFDLKPKSPAYRASLNEYLARLSGTLVELGDHDGAARAAGDLVGKRKDAAILLSRCSQLASSDRKLSASDREALAGAYADRAIALLRESIERSEPGFATLLEEKAFGPLKLRDAYKTLPFLVSFKTAGGAR